MRNLQKAVQPRNTSREIERKIQSNRETTAKTQSAMGTLVFGKARKSMRQVHQSFRQGVTNPWPGQVNVNLAGPRKHGE